MLVIGRRFFFFFYFVERRKRGEGEDGTVCELASSPSTLCAQLLPHSLCSLPPFARSLPLNATAPVHPEYTPRHVPPLFMTLFSTSITNAIDFSGGILRLANPRSGTREKFISIRSPAPRLIFALRNVRKEGFSREFPYSIGYRDNWALLEERLNWSFRDFNYLIS